jgi:hypothetical protein
VTYIWLNTALNKVVASRGLRHLATRVILSPPALAEALRDIETFTEYPLAPSHRAFLEQHDGLNIGLFHHSNPSPQEAPVGEFVISSCAEIRADTQNLRDFFDLAYVGTVEDVTHDTAKRFFAVARSAQLDRPILAFPEVRAAYGEYQLIEPDIGVSDWLDDLLHPYVNIVDQSFEAFLRKSLEHLEFTGTRFEYWWPPGSWS